VGLVLQHTTLTNFVIVPVPFHYPLFDPYSFFSILLARDVTTTTATTTSLRLLPTGFSQVAHVHLGPLSLRSQRISRLGLHPALRSCNDLVLQSCLNPNLTTLLLEGAVASGTLEVLRCYGCSQSRPTPFQFRERQTSCPFPSLVPSSAAFGPVRS